MKRKNFDLITNLKGKIMKKLTITAIITGLSLSAMSGTTCRTDYLGNVHCAGTGQSIGYSSTTRTDYLGNRHYSDNRGNNITCTTDYLGNRHCN